MTTTLRTLSALTLLACGSTPQSTASIEIEELDGSVATGTATGRVAWTGGGEQIMARIPNRGDPDEAFSAPLRITRLGPYQADQPVMARVLGRSWVSTDEAPAQIVVDRTWFSGDADFPWRHLGTVQVLDPRPVGHGLDILSFKAEFSIQGPDCTTANPGESRCGVPWTLGEGSVELELVELENDCPDYVIETWIGQSQLTASGLQMSAEGYKDVRCIDTGEGRRLCGSNEDEMEVGSCLWNATLALEASDTLRIDGVAFCGESSDLDSCTARYRMDPI